MGAALSHVTETRVGKMSKSKTSPSNGGGQEYAPSMMIGNIPYEILEIPIIGVTSLLMNRFGHSPIEAIQRIEAQKKKVKMPREPMMEFRESFYRLPENADDPDHRNWVVGFPLLAFKAATVSAARFYDKSVSMVGLRQCLWFIPEEYEVEDRIPLVRLEVPEIPEKPRVDPVTVRNGGTTLRYRPEFPEWRAVLKVRYVKSSIGPEDLLSLIAAGGANVGVGEWRPQGKGGNSGIYGTYRVDNERELIVRPVQSVPYKITEGAAVPATAFEGPAGELT